MNTTVELQNCSSGIIKYKSVSLERLCVETVLWRFQWHMIFIAFIFTSFRSDVFTCWESYGFFYEGPVLKPFTATVLPLWPHIWPSHIIVDKYPCWRLSAAAAFINNEIVKDTDTLKYGSLHILGLLVGILVECNIML